MGERDYVSVNLKRGAAKDLAVKVKAMAVLVGEPTTKSEVLAALLELADEHPEEFLEELTLVMSERQDRRRIENRTTP